MRLRPLVFCADDPRGRVERVGRRIDADPGDLPRQHGGRVNMGEGRGECRVGQIVCWRLDRLHRGDRTLLGRGDGMGLRGNVC